MFSKVIFLCLAWNWVAIAGPIVHIPHTDNTYRGVTIDLVDHFQNIKFAHDTSGRRRFAPPEPFMPSPGSDIDATAPGAACPQIRQAMPPFFDETTNMSEDCLNLRIARPFGTTSNDNLPVVVWVHGGGVVKGSAYDSHTDPQKLVQHSVAIGKPIIFVAINYRLSIFGFAKLPILEDQKSLNIGVRDQRAAFEWIKDNIASFGGNPELITAYGLSAGGTFTSLHIVSYGGAKGVPFTQAWVMSGPPGTALNMSSDVTMLHTLAVADELGCSNKNDESVLQCLRDAPMEVLRDTALEYSIANRPPAGLFTFIPSIDGDIFPERQSILYRRGDFVKGIPMVLGWTQDDGAINAGPAHQFHDKWDVKALLRDFPHTLKTEDINMLSLLYDAEDFEGDVESYHARKDASDTEVSVHFFRISRILRDLLFTCSSIDFGYYVNKHSRMQDPGFAGVRLYNLNRSMLTPIWKGAEMPYIGVSHGSDTNYIFAGLFPEGDISAEDSALSIELTDAFLNFAYTGKPGGNADDQENWPEAFKSTSGTDPPHEFSIQVIEGPYRTGPANLKDSAASFENEGTEYTSSNEGAQNVLQGEFEMGSMEPPSSHSQNRGVEHKWLHARCKFINSLAEELGV